MVQNEMPAIRENTYLISDQVVAILGMGLMGSSLALAMKGHCKKVIGIDPDPMVVEYVLQHEMVSEAWSEPAGKINDARSGYPCCTGWEDLGFGETFTGTSYRSAGCIGSGVQ